MKNYHKSIFIIILFIVGFTVSCHGNDYLTDLNKKTTNTNNALSPTNTRVADLKDVKKKKYDFFDILVAEHTEDKDSYIFTAYDFIIFHHKKKIFYYLFTSHTHDIEKTIKPLENNYYSIEYYSGGNNINAESFQLIKVDKNHVYHIGRYKGFKEVKGKKMFYLTLRADDEKSYAHADYHDCPLIIKDNKFQFTDHCNITKPRYYLD